MMTFVSRHRWISGFGLLLCLLVVAVLVFQWDWLIPFVDKQASAALGRPVTITHLHVRLGRTTTIEADGVTLANPPDWQGGGNFATIDRLSLDVLALDYIKSRQLTLPRIELQSPKIDAQQLADGKSNWGFGSSNSTPSTSPAPQLGDLVINDGQVHFRDAKLKSDFTVALATKEDSAKPGTSQIVADAKGTYGGQPVTAEFKGGALLSLRDATQPYPVDLKVANGPTRVSLQGTVQNPLSFAGANLKLDLAGPDMSLLFPLTGIPIPKTPAYRIAGRLDYQAGTVKFDDFNGKVGSSDLAGSIDVDTTPKERPTVTANLQSKLVDLKDLGGFIGAEPGDADKGTKRVANHTGRVLPNDPISMPKLNSADVHLKYRAAHIEGRRQPLDNMRADLDITDGTIHLHPLSFGLGRGTITGDITLAEDGRNLKTKAAVDFQRIDIDKLLESAGVGRGAGTIGGRMVIDGTGNSVATILGHGNGELKLYMGHGGNLSALLVDISGLQFGNAFLSAIGVPTRETIECVIVDVPMAEGVANARTVLIDTEDSRIGINGFINFRTEGLDLVTRTESKHFSVGSLPTPIDIKGTFANPSIAPEAGPLAARAGAAVALGILATPLAALIPTIQLGTGEDNACHGLLGTATSAPHAPEPARR